MNYKHLFISGPPRSGTTLLELMVSAHSCVTITPESRFIHYLIRKSFFPPVIINNKKAAEIKSLMQADQKLRSWPSFDLDAFLDRIDMRGRRLNEIIDELFISYADNNNGNSVYMGNKKELYSGGYGKYIKKLFPDSRFIFIVRDPRDVTRSVLKNLSIKEFNRAASVCAHHHRHMGKMLKKFSEDVLVIRYEDLVREPEKICRDICHFLKLNYEEDMLSFYEKNRDGSRLLSLTKNIHANTRDTFNPNLIDQWKQENTYSTEQLCLIESINKHFMLRYGYSFSGKKKFNVKSILRSSYHSYCETSINSFLIAMVYYLK